eukprot:TRINITY_DN45563_c0_g1_i1.p1 TRINITY_DN45563_c0_g1~~TRINITY_DN45563_c0_g1_i1.p1  ORF type:complete len:467 (+),score=58.33 TRINITY_DN45563_c0_g1_i1:111-1511(+)
MQDISLIVPTKSDKRVLGPDFVLYGTDPSYFTGKLEMYLRYRELNFVNRELAIEEWQRLSKEKLGIDPQMPFLEDRRDTTPADRRWLRDTTSIIEYLENDVSLAIMPPTGIIPSCPVKSFLSFLVEDYADEELWRPAMYYRWAPRCDGLCMSTRFTFEIAKDHPLLQLPGRPFLARFLYMRQWFFSIFGEGIDSDEKHKAVQDQYVELLDVLENILQGNPYVSGSRPTVADFGLAGPFFRHFSSDPTPRKIMQQRAPAVYEWIARLWNSRLCDMHFKGKDVCVGEPRSVDVPYGWERLLPVVARYLEYLQLNAQAWTAGQDFFLFNDCQVPVVPYRVWCRKQLQERFLALHVSHRARIEMILQDTGCWKPLFGSATPDNDAALRREVVDSPPEGGTAPPFCSIVGEKKHMGYKWPAKPLMRRYIQKRLAPRVAVAIAVFAFLMSRGRRPRQAVMLAIAFTIGRLSK